jgi:hypothetical protein
MLGNIQKESPESNKAILDAVQGLEKSLQDTLKEEGNALRNAVQKADRARRLEFALQNLSLVTHFDYYTSKMQTANSRHNKPYYCPSKCNTRDTMILTSILLVFRRNLGYWISDIVITDNIGYNTIYEIKPEWKKSFQDRLSRELFTLLGEAPRCVYKEDGGVLVFQY